MGSENLGMQERRPQREAPRGPSVQQPRHNISHKRGVAWRPHSAPSSSQTASQQQPPGCGMLHVLRARADQRDRYCCWCHAISPRRRPLQRSCRRE